MNRQEKGTLNNQSASSPHFPGAWLEPFLFLWPHVSPSQNHCRNVENPSDGGIPYSNIFSQASAL